MVVEKDQRTECLVLRRLRDVLLHSEVFEERDHVWRAELRQVGLAVRQDVALGPGNAGSGGGLAAVAEWEAVSDLVKESHVWHLWWRVGRPPRGESLGSTHRGIRRFAGVGVLTNANRGLGSVEFPRRPLNDVIMECAPPSASISHPSLLIRINRQFEYGMSAQALYENTRGISVIGNRRQRAKLAMPVYARVIREVYEIESWHRAGSTHSSTRNRRELAQQCSRRWEFVGDVAAEATRNMYVGYFVQDLFRPGQQSPVVGVGLE